MTYGSWMMVSRLIIFPASRLCLNFDHLLRHNLFCGPPRKRTSEQSQSNLDDRISKFVWFGRFLTISQIQGFPSSTFHVSKYDNATKALKKRKLDRRDINETETRRLFILIFFGMDCLLLQNLVYPCKIIRSSADESGNLERGSLKGCSNGAFPGGLNESAAASFGTVDAEITQETVDFFVSDAEGDPDRPSNGFSSIDKALNVLREGKFVIAVDDENGNEEGDLITAASLVDLKAVAFMIKLGSGIISVGMKEDDLERLRLPMMSPITEIEDLSASASTVTVDARVGTSTGVSAADRAKTILALSSPDSRPGDFRRPGHVFPLKYRSGGVLQRAGHTEASVDLVSLAGLRPVSVLSTIIDQEDGSMAQLPVLRKIAEEYGLPIISITDLIRYRRKREKLAERTAVSHFPTRWGVFNAYCYKSKLDGIEHVAVVKGDIGDGQDVLVRVHSECLTGDIFGSARCDCGNQLALAMQLIEQNGRGVLVYLRGHEGRGIGLGHKLRAYNLQDLGHDTVEANLELGLAVDARDYGIGAQILRDLGVQTMQLMTNNLAKFTGLKGYGLAMIGRVPVITPITEENKRYLETKRTKMGHVYGSDLPGTFPGYIDPNLGSTGP